MPEPIASGTLDQTPLAHVLVHVDQRKLSGTLAVWPDDEGEQTPKGQDRVLFVKGRPVAARLREPASELREGLLRLFERTSAPYAFYEANLLGDDRLNGRVDAFALITEAQRERARDDVVEKVITRFGDSRLQLRSEADLDRYSFDPQEHELVRTLQVEPANVAALVAVGGLPEARVHRLVYVLAITKAVTARGSTPQPVSKAAPQPTAEAPQPPAAASRSAAPAAADMPSLPPAPTIDTTELHAHLDELAMIPSPPSELSEALRERWHKVVTKGRLIENQNYFEMLGLERTAKASDVRMHFLQLAKEWHPDRLPRELGPIKRYVDVIFAYLSEANTTLGNEDTRIQYLQTLREGGGTPATERLMQQILDSAMEFERVLVLTRQHRYDRALEILQRVLQVHKDEPTYHAHRAMLLLKVHPKDDGILPEVLDACDRAIALHADHEMAHMYRAQVLRRMGKLRESLAAYKRVVELNPRNIEAAREVRIASMRRDSSPKKKAEKAASGFLNKLFKK